jgi:integrase
MADRKSTPRRRAPGEGSVFKLPTGQWRAESSYTDPTTVQRRRVARLGATRKEALARLAAARQAQTAAEVRSALAPQTVAGYLAHWLQSIVKPFRAPATYVQYDQAVRLHLTPALGHLRLAALHPRDVQACISALAARQPPLSPRTIQLAHATLRAALHHAERTGEVPRNVARGTALPPVGRSDARGLSVADAQAVLRASRDHEAGSYVALALCTGLRGSELLGLRWQDVDFSAPTLHVRQQVQQYGGRRVAVLGIPGQVIRPPKSAAGTRIVPLVPRAVAALQRERQRQRAARLLAGPLWQAGGDWVFTTGDGRPRSLHWISQGWRRALAAAGVAHVVPHSARHTVASLLLAEGIDPVTVASILGHSDATVTLRIYGHAVAGTAAAGMGRLGAVLGDADEG